MSTQTMTETGVLSEAFARFDSTSPVHAQRRAAFEAFQTAGFPTPRDERWRYTNPKPLVAAATALASPAHVTSDQLKTHFLPESHRLVFVNGRYAPEHSDLGTAEGVRFDSLANVMTSDFASLEPHFGSALAYNDDAFMHLNSAFFADGAFVHLSRNAVMERPLHVLFVSTPDATPAMNCPRVLVVADAFSQASIVEQYVTIADGDSAGNGTTSLTNALTEIVVTGDDANIDHYKVQGEAEDAGHYSSLQVVQHARSTVTSHCFATGGTMTRNTIDAQLRAEGCECTFNGLFLTHGTQLVDNHLRIDHLVPNCNSWQFYKGVLDDRSRGVFSGRIYVAEDAQKTDAKQTNMNLLLSNTAHVDTKPQLEIFADDVKCTHGATIGQLEESQLFYLRARGIDRDAARSMLIYAFANATIAEVKVDALRDRLERVLMERLPRAELLEGGR